MVAVFTGFIIESIHARESQQNTHLNIDISFESKKIKKSLLKTTQKACKNLEKNLQVTTGPFGFGYFNSVNCYMQLPKKKSKKKSKNKFIQPRPQDATYHLRLLIGENLEFKLIKTNSKTFYRKKEFINVPSKIIYEKNFDAGESFDEVIERQDFLRVVSLHILTHLPALLKLDGQYSNVQGDKIIGSSEEDTVFDDLPPPPKLAIYHLFWRKHTKLWDVESIGDASRLSDANKERLLNSRNLVEEAPVWGFKGNRTRFDSLNNLYAGIHPSEAKWLDQVDNFLNEISEEVIEESNAGFVAMSNAVANIIGGTLASGYVGFRFGLPVLPGAIFIEKSQFFGLLAEFRSGILDGLRIYVDHWPEVKETVDGQNAEFGGTRAIAAWALQMQVPYFEILSFDITPKIGQWTFKTILPIAIPNATTGESETRSVEFEIDNSLSLGIEVGLEYATPAYLLRGWTSRDFGQSLDEAQVTSVFATRYGLDLHVGLPAAITGGLQLSLLGFGFFEDVTLNKKIDSDSLQVNDVQADEVGFSQLYIGGGLTVVW